MNDDATGAAEHASTAGGARSAVLVGLAVALLLAVFGLVARGQMVEWGLVRPGPE